MSIFSHAHQTGCRSALTSGPQSAADAAEAYVRHGWALVSIPAGKKGPQTPKWNTLANAVTSPARAAALTGNIGLAHAFCSPCPTAALDVDDYDAAKAWLSERGIDLDGLLDAPDAVQIVSGRPGRNKLLYRLPDGAKAIPTVQISSAATKAMVLEFRCAAGNGLTVQDVLPPSIHPETGRPYTWGGAEHWTRPPVMPPALVDLWKREGARKPSMAANRRSALWFSKSVDDTPRQRARLAAMLGFISADCSYERYRDIVWAILSLGWQDAEQLAKDWCQTALHRFNEDEFDLVVTSYDASRSPSMGTIVHFAREGGWDE